MNENDDLRELFDEATRDIRPRTTYDDIRSRIDQEDPVAQQARRWFAPALVAAAVMALVVGGAFWMTRDDGGSPGSATQPTITASATEDPQEVTRDAPVFFVAQTPAGRRLVRDTVVVRTCETSACLMLAAVSTAVDGPAGDPDYSTPWAQVPEHTGLVVNTDGGEILIDFEAPDGAADPVDLTVRPARMDALGAELAVQQLVYTARAALGEDLPVRFRINHADTPTLLGVATAEPLTAADPDEIQAPVQITNLRDGQSVEPGSLTVSGVAAAFEANVLWELTGADGAVVQDGFATAAECCTLSPYSFEITGLEPGTYTLTVRDEDASGEGRPTNADTKRIVVE